MKIDESTTKDEFQPRLRFSTSVSSNIFSNQPCLTKQDDGFCNCQSRICSATSDGRLVFFKLLARVSHLLKKRTVRFALCEIPCNLRRQSLPCVMLKMIAQKVGCRGYCIVCRCFPNDSLSSGMLNIKSASSSANTCSEGESFVYLEGGQVCAVQKRLELNYPRSRTILFI